MCLCTTPMAKCVPTERAKSLGRLVFYIMIVLTIVLIVGFVAGSATTQSLFCVGLVITGMCGVRSDTAYDIEQIMCVVFFSGYLWVYALVELILYLVAGDQEATALTAYFGGVIFYAVSCYFAKLLYDELRLNYNQPAPGQQPQGMFGGGGMMGRMMGGGGRMGQQQPQQQQQQPGLAQQGYQQGGYNQQPVNAAAQQRGNIPPAAAQNQSSAKFQAFKGVGHSMS